MLLGLSSASGSGEDPYVGTGDTSSSSSSHGDPGASEPMLLPRLNQRTVSETAATVAATIAAAAAADDEDPTHSGKRRTQVAALPRKEWSLAEDELIRNGVQQLGCKWRVIAAQLPGRSDDAVRNRWSRLQESMRGPEQRPPKPHSAASSGAGPSHSSGAPAADSARQPGSPVKLERKGSADKKERTSWTRAEDDVIVQCVAELGHKWFEIARRLPGRTDHAIRNRWSRLQSILGLNDATTGHATAQEVGAAALSLSMSRSNSDLGPNRLAQMEAIAAVQAHTQTTPRTTPLSPAHSLDVAELSLAKHGLYSLSQRADGLPGAPPAAESLLPPQAAPPPQLQQPPPQRVLADPRAAVPGTHAPPPSPMLQPAAPGAERNGTAELLLFHKLGSRPASDQASPFSSPVMAASPGTVLPGAEQLASLPPGALPEGSAELLLLKKARVG